MKKKWTLILIFQTLKRQKENIRNTLMSINEKSQMKWLNPWKTLIYQN